MTETLTLQGIIYPPPRPGPGARTVENACEEFDIGELRDQLDNIRGLPIVLEHDMSKLIGKVTEAEITHSGAVQVTAVVNASTEVGRRAMEDIRNKKMTGLSLSHEYNLFAKDGCPLQIKLDSSTDWRNLAHTKGESVVIKKMRELSVCRDPARSGCYIHSLSDKKSLCGLVNASRQELEQQVSTNINAAPSSLEQREDKLCLSLWNIVSKSTNMEPASATPADPSPAPVVPDNAVPVPDSVTGELPGIAAVDATDPSSVQPASTEVAPADAVPADSVEVPPPDDAPPPEATTADYEQALTAAAKSVEENMTRAEVAEERLRKMQCELDESQKESRDKLEKANGEKEKVQQALAAAHSKTEARRKSDRETALGTLREKLKASGVGPKIQNQDPDRNNRDDVAATIHDAINAIQHLSKATASATETRDMAKRDHADVIGALQPFGGTNTLGTVNASAKRAKTEQQLAPDTTTESARRMAHVQTTQWPTWSDAKHYWNSPQPVKVGIVSASRNQWTHPTPEAHEERTPLCMRQMQPELFAATSNMNSGCKPNAAQVKELFDSVHQGNPNVPRR